MLALLIKPIRRMLEQLSGVDQHLADVVVLVGGHRPHARRFPPRCSAGVFHTGASARTFLTPGCWKAHSTIARTASVA